MNELVTNLPTLNEEQLAKFREWLIGMLKMGPVTVTFNKNIEAIYPKKNWYKKFEKYWEPSEENAEKIFEN